MFSTYQLAGFLMIQLFWMKCHEYCVLFTFVGIIDLLDTDDDNDGIPDYMDDDDDGDGVPDVQFSKLGLRTPLKSPPSG